MDGSAVGKCVVVACGLAIWGCSATPERKFAKYLHEGKSFLAKKDYARASLKFKNAATAMPQHAEPYYQLGNVSLMIGDGAAAGYLNQAATLDPKHVPAMAALAEVYAQSLHEATVQEAQKLAQRVITLEPENLRALNAIALADLRQGNRQAASERLEDLLKRFPEHGQTSINLARVRLAEKDWRGAEALLRDAVSRSESDTTAIFALADFYHIVKDDEKAAEWYARGLEREPDHTRALAAISRLHVKAGRKQEAKEAFERLAKSGDRRYRYAYGTYLLGSDSKDAGIAEFERIYKMNPEDREARTRLSEAYLVSNRVNQAEKLITGALAHNTSDADALVQRATIHLSRGKIDAAEDDVQAALQHKPDWAEAHYLSAQVQRARMRLELQQQELSETLRLDPRHSAARTELAKLFLTRKDPSGSLSVLDAAPQELRKDPSLRIHRIWPLLELNRLAEARTEIDTLAPLGNPEVSLQDAFLRIRQGDIAGARTSAQNALTINPGDVRALELILRCAVAGKKPAEGLAAVRNHAAQHRKTAAVQVFAGKVEFQAGNSAQARAAFETALAADPKMLAATWSLIDLDMVERKFDDARGRLAPLLAGPHAAVAAVKLGLIEQETGNYQAASEHFGKALQTNPRDVTALNSLAYILSAFLKKPADALRYAQTAKELSPDNAAVDDTLGWTYYNLGVYPSAIRHLEMAVKREPSALRNAHLAMAYANNGDPARAKNALAAALKINPQLPEALVAQKAISVSNKVN